MTYNKKIAYITLHMYIFHYFDAMHEINLNGRTDIQSQDLIEAFRKIRKSLYHYSH